MTVVLAPAITWLVMKILAARTWGPLGWLTRTVTAQTCSRVRRRTTPLTIGSLRMEVGWPGRARPAATQIVIILATIRIRPREGACTPTAWPPATPGRTSRRRFSRQYVVAAHGSAEDNP